MYQQLKVHQVYARSLNHCIGIRNRLPWECPGDMKHFRTITKGKVLIMGRKTFESLPQPLKNRRLVIVVTSDRSYGDHLKDIPKHVVAHSVIEAMDIASNQLIEEVFIVGGRSIYLEALDLTDIIHESVINVNVKGDSYIDWEIPEHIEVNTTWFSENIVARAPLNI